MFALRSQTSSASELPDSHHVLFESNSHGASCWEDLQRVSLGLKKCEEIMESYSADSLKEGVSMTISLDQIKVKLGLANIALGRSMQSLLQTSFLNVHRGASDSTAQIPVQVRDATVAAFSSRPPISARPSTGPRQSAVSGGSPISTTNLESHSAKRSSVAPQRPSTSHVAPLSMATEESKESSPSHLQSTASYGVVDFESNSVKQSSIAPQQSASSDSPSGRDGKGFKPLSRLSASVKAVMAANALQRGGVHNLNRQQAQRQFLDDAEDAAVSAPLSMATWESKRSSQAPHLSVASDGAANSQSNSAKRSSIAPQRLTSSDGAPLSIATWESKRSSLAPRQSTVSDGAPLSIAHLESTSLPKATSIAHSADAVQKNEIIASINARVASERIQNPLHSSSSVDSSDDDDVQPLSGNWHRADALNMELHAASRPKHLSVSSIPSLYDQSHADGTQVTKARPRLSVSNGHGSRFAPTTNDSDLQTGLSDFSRHLLGGSFEHKNSWLEERGSSSHRSRAAELGRNGYNPTAVSERSSVFERASSNAANSNAGSGSALRQNISQEQWMQSPLKWRTTQQDARDEDRQFRGGQR